MSYVSTYERRLPKTKGIGLAIGVHAVVIAAVIVMPGIEIPERFEGTIIAFPVPEPEQPKAVPEPKDPIVEAPRTEKIQTPVPPIDNLPKAPDEKLITFTSGDDGLTLGGGGEGIDIPFDPIEAIEPTPDPIIVEAQLNNRFSSQFQPRYPSGLLRLDEEGVVSVRVLVGTNGRAKNIELISSPHVDFWTATRKHALRKWRFKPATKDGKPIESWITLKVRFKINR